jgi:hypothetical protein
VITVALACGFTSPSHFSKCYRGHYNRTPYRERGVADAASRGGVLPAAAVLPIEGPYDSAIETAPPTGADIEFDDMPDEEDDAFLDGPLDPRA